jgi:hypothetical protein
MQKKGKPGRRRQRLDRRHRIPERTHGILRKMIRARHAELSAAESVTGQDTSSNSE